MSAQEERAAAVARVVRTARITGVCHLSKEACHYFDASTLENLVRCCSILSGSGYVETELPRWLRGHDDHPISSGHSASEVPDHRSSCRQLVL